MGVAAMIELRSVASHTVKSLYAIDCISKDLFRYYSTYDTIIIEKQNQINGNNKCKYVVLFKGLLVFQRKNLLLQSIVRD